jgi:hypothetical protein
VPRYQKFPHDDKGNYRIRDYENNKWLTDANGRQYRTNSDRTDEIIEELEERTD